MRSLIRYLLAIGVVMTLGMTLALGFDESGIDFEDEDVSTAYVMLDRGAEGLTVVLSAAKATGFVATMDVEDELADYDVDDFDSATEISSRPWAPRAFPTVLEVKNSSTVFHTIRMIHDESMTTVMAAYLDRLAALGYEVTAEPVTSNIEAYTVTQGDETLRMVITRKGGSTTAVTLTAL